MEQPNGFSETFNQNGQWDVGGAFRLLCRGVQWMQFISANPTVKRIEYQCFSQY
jgi:hypothetical protein